MESDFLGFIFFYKKVTFWDFSHWVPLCILCRAWHFEFFLDIKVTFWDFFTGVPAPNILQTGITSHPKWLFEIFLDIKVTFWDFFDGSITLLNLYCTYFYLFLPFHLVLHSENSGFSTCGSHRENFLKFVFDGFHLHSSSAAHCPFPHKCQVLSLAILDVRSGYVKKWASPCCFSLVPEVITDVSHKSWPSWQHISYLYMYKCGVGLVLDLCFKKCKLFHHTAKCNDSTISQRIVNCKKACRTCQPLATANNCQTCYDCCSQLNILSALVSTCKLSSHLSNCHTGQHLQVSTLATSDKCQTCEDQ